MFKFWSIYYVVLVIHVGLICAEISNKRLCANPDCSAPVSLANSILIFGSNDQRILSFRPNEEVIIYSKSAGNKPDLWGAEINGKRGYVPKTHVRETRIFISDLKFEVDTDENSVKSDTVGSEPTGSQETLSPDRVQPVAEIIDGTTVYQNNDVTATESATESDILHHKETEPLPSKNVKDDHGKLKDTITKTKNVVENVFSPLVKHVQGDSESVEDDISEVEVNDETDDVVIAADEDLKDTYDAKDENDKIQAVTDKLKSATLEGIPNYETVLEGQALPGSAKSSINTPDDTVTISISETNMDQGLKLADSDNIVISTISDISEEGVLKDEHKDKRLLQEPQNPITKEKEMTHPQSMMLSEESITEDNSDSLASEEVKNENIELELNLTENVSVDTHAVQLPKEQTISTLNSNNNSPVNDQGVKISHGSEKAIESKNQQKQVDVNVENQKLQDQANNDISQKPDGAMSKINISQENAFTDSNEEPRNTKKVDDALHHIINLSGPTSALDVNHSVSPKDNSANLKITDNLATSGQEIPFHSLLEHTHDAAGPVNHDLPTSFEAYINPSPGLLPDTFTSSKNTELHKTTDKVIDKKENIIDAENLNPTTAPEVSDNSFQNIILPTDGDLGSYNDNVVEEANSDETSGVLFTTPFDQNIIAKDTETNEIVTENSAHQSFGKKEVENIKDKHIHDLDGLLSKPNIADQGSCLAGFHESDCPQDDGFHESDCPQDDCFHHSSIKTSDESIVDFYYFKLPILAYEVFLVLVISAVTVVVFLWGYIYIDRSRKEVPLVAKINDLQKQFLILKKENELLTEKVLEVENENISKAEAASNEIVEDLKFQLTEAENVRLSLEQQIQNLEKELENSTEVGLELNRMLSEFLVSDNGSDNLIANIDQLQRQLIDQQGTINTYNETINIKETENHELRLELEINNSRVNELQSELNKMAINLLKVEEDKEHLQSIYETDMASLKKQLEGNTIKFKFDLEKISEEFGLLKKKYEVSQRNLEMKTNEYKLLKENINQVNSDNNNSDVLKSMFDATSIKAELLQLRNENQLLNERIQQESSRTSAFEKQAYLAMEDAQLLKTKYDNADRERMEAQTKLEILSNYFKEREAQLQKELTKQESMWIEKQGEASSTIERIKYMQEELKNNKAQYESLKQEIVAQEVDMKSQISVLEKKAHENWVAARQAERKLEDAKQEAAQLRNRLTLRERNLNDEKVQNRVVSPLEQNGDLVLNDSGTSLPLMFGTREHLTSPPLPSLPHFLPPPPGVPFMPPPLGGVPLPPPGFLPPPPSMIPGDHRPPPLGRMSSPPLNSRYSPDSRGYSPYSRNSPSPTSDDEYDRHLYRSYSPYNREDRRDFSRPPPPPVNRNSMRNHRGTHSSGSAHSNESLEKVNRHNSKV